MGVIDLEPLAEAIGGKLSSRIPWQSEGLGEGAAQKRIAERAEDERKSALGDMMVLVADAQLCDQIAQRIENGIEGIPVAGEDHPGCERSSAFAAEDIEGAVDDVAGVRFAGTRPLDRSCNARRNRIGDRSSKLALEASGRAEMMKEVSMRPTDLGRDRFQGHGLGSVGEKQAPRRLNRGRAALFGAQSFSSY